MKNFEFDVRFILAWMSSRKAPILLLSLIASLLLVTITIITSAINSLNKSQIQGIDLPGKMHTIGKESINGFRSLSVDQLKLIKLRRFEGAKVFGVLPIQNTFSVMVGSNLIPVTVEFVTKEYLSQLIRKTDVANDGVYASETLLSKLEGFDDILSIKSQLSNSTHKVLGTLPKDYKGLVNGVDLVIDESLLGNVFGFNETSVLTSLFTNNAYTFAYIPYELDVNREDLDYELLKVTGTSGERFKSYPYITKNPLFVEKQLDIFHKLLLLLVVLASVVTVGITKHFSSDVISRKKEIDLRRMLGMSFKECIFLFIKEKVVYFIAISLISLMLLLYYIYSTDVLFVVLRENSGISIVYLTVALSFVCIFAVIVSIYQAWLSTKGVNSSDYQNRVMTITGYSISIFLLFCIISLYPSLFAKSTVDMGFEMSNKYAFEVSHNNLPGEMPMVGVPAENLVEYIRENNQMNLAYSSHSILQQSLAKQHYLLESSSSTKYDISSLSVSRNFFDFFDIDIIEGRVFVNNEENIVLVNEAFIKKYKNLSLGSYIYTETYDMAFSNLSSEIRGTQKQPHRIIGITANANLESVNNIIEPVVYTPIRFTSEISTFFSSSSKKIDTSERFTFEKMKSIESSYRRQMSNIHLLLKMMAIVAIVVLINFALTAQNNSFQTLHKNRKSLSIRIVLGASKGDIIMIHLHRMNVDILVALLIGCILWLLSIFHFDLAIEKQAWIYNYVFLGAVVIMFQVFNCIPLTQFLRMELWDKLTER